LCRSAGCHLHFFLALLCPTIFCLTILTAERYYPHRLTSTPKAPNQAPRLSRVKPPFCANSTIVLAAPQQPSRTATTNCSHPTHCLPHIDILPMESYSQLQPEAQQQQHPHSQSLPQPHFPARPPSTPPPSHPRRQRKARRTRPWRPHIHSRDAFQDQHDDDDPFSPPKEEVINEPACDTSCPKNGAKVLARGGRPGFFMARHRRHRERLQQQHRARWNEHGWMNEDDGDDEYWSSEDEDDSYSDSDRSGYHSSNSDDSTDSLSSTSSNSSALSISSLTSSCCSSCCDEYCGSECSDLDELDPDQNEQLELQLGFHDEVLRLREMLSEWIPVLFTTALAPHLLNASIAFVGRHMAEVDGGSSRAGWWNPFNFFLRHRTPWSTLTASSSSTVSGWRRMLGNITSFQWNPSQLLLSKMAQLNAKSGGDAPTSANGDAASASAAVSATLDAASDAAQIPPSSPSYSAPTRTQRR